MQTDRARSRRWVRAVLGLIGVVLVGTFAVAILAESEAAPAGTAYLAADLGGAGGGDDLLTRVDVTDPNPITNESAIGTGLGTSTIRGLGVQPGTGQLFGSTATGLGMINVGSGVFSPVGSGFGTGTGAAGAVAFDKVEGIAFQPSTGFLFAVHQRGGHDVIFRVDPTTGSAVPGHFGGSDYIEIVPSQSTYDDFFDIAFDPVGGGLYGIASDGNSQYQITPIALATGVATTPGVQIGAALPHGLGFDATGQAFVVGSPGAGGVYAPVDHISGTLGTTYPLDDTTAYEAIAFPVWNQAPLFDQDYDGRSSLAGASVSLATYATDPDGDPVTYSATGLPPGLAINPSTGLISGTISAGAMSGSPYAVVAIATDPGGAIGTDSFVWFVVPPPTGSRILYGDGVTNEPWVRDWDGSTWSARYASASIHEWRVVTGAASQTRDEAIAVGVNIHNDIRGEMWDGTGWSEFSFGTAASINQNYWWSQAVAYERLSGDAVLVYSTGKSDTTPIAYRVWNGSAWTAEAKLTVPVSSIMRQLRLAASPDSDEMVLVASDDGSRDYAFVWNGSSWSSARTLSSSGAGDDRTDVFVAYEQQSGDALVVYGRGSSSLLYQTWNGTSWTAEASLAVPSPATGNVRWTTLASDPRSDRIAVGVTTTSAHSWTAIWNGTGWGNTQVLTQSAPGTTFPSVGVAFESQSGEAIALYGSSTSDLRYRRWSGAAWSGEGVAFNVAAIPNSVTLNRDPSSDRMMAVVQNNKTELYGSQWSGSTWATPTELEQETKEVKNQPWVFLWGRSDQPPVFFQDLGDRTDPEGAAVSFSAAADDPYGDPLTYAATGLPPGVTIGSSTGLVSGTIGQTAATGSPYSVQITVVDPGGNGAIDTFTWSVTAVNVAPEVNTVPDQASTETDTVSLAMVGSDIDGDPVTWSATGLPAGLAIDPGSGVVSGTITYDGATGSPHLVTIRIQDNAVPPLFAETSFSWTVANINRPPVVADPGTRSNAEGDPVAFAMVGSDPDGDGLTWTASGLPDGLSIAPSGGVISGTLTYLSAGTHSVTVRATDDGSPNLFGEVTFTWNVSDTNRAPVVANPGDQADAENDAVALGMIGGDPDGDGLVWSATGLPAGLSMDPVSGFIAGTLTYDSAGSHGVTVRATDDGSPTLFTEVQFTWNVANTNRAPLVADPGAQGAVEGAVVSLSMSVFEPDGDVVVWSAGGLPAGLSIDPASGLISGTLTYTSSGSYVVTARATDNGTPSLFGETSFAFDVGNTNRAPLVTNPGARSNAEGNAISLPVLGSDPDGNTITWSATGLPPGLLIDPTTGTISGTLTYVASGTYSVTVRATDDGSPVLFTEVVFTWSVANTNRAPLVTNPGSTSDAENDTVSIAVVGSDPDGNALTWTATGLPGGLSIAPGTGVISGTIGYSSAGTHSVTVRATDNGSPNLYTEVSFTWNVADTNRPPIVGNPGNQNMAEGDSVSLSVTAWEPDGDTITWSATGLPGGLSISPATGLISGTLTYTSSGSYPVVVRVTDNGSPVLFSEVSFTWAVANTNRAPIVTNPGDRNNAEGALIALPVVGSDPDGNTLTWTATGLPGGLSIAPGTGVISGTIGFDAAGVHTVTVRATDDGSPVLFSEVTFTWAVANTNRAPVVLNPGPQTNNEGASVSLAISASDPDGNGIGYSATGLPAGLAINPTSGVITGTLGYDVASSYSVVVSVIDNGSPPASSQVSFSWTVGDVNRPPVLTALPDRTDEQFTVVTVTPSAIDPDGNAMSWSAAGLPAGTSIAATTGVVTGTPTAAGAFTVTITVTDSGTPALSDADTFTWTVRPPPGFPLIGAIGNYSSFLGQSASLAPSGSHPDGLGLTWSATGLPAGISIDETTGKLSGVPTADGSFDVVVTLTDTRDQAVEASFTWNVIDPDLPPVATDDVVSVQIDEVGSGVAVDVAGNDIDPEGGVLSLISIGVPEVGEATIVDGIVVFTPPLGWLGTVSFEYTVADAAGNTDSSTVTITIEESLSDQLAASALQWEPAAQPTVDVDRIALDPGDSTQLVLGSVVQSLYVLRLPLALLGGAVFWSLVLGGILNLGFVLRGGIPRVVRRTSRNVAVVMVPHGMKLEAMTEPGGGKPIHRFLATERGVEATGRRTDVAGREWAEVKTPNGHGWVLAFNLTEEVDRLGFAEDPEPRALLSNLVVRLRARQDITDLVSHNGLAISHHGPVIHYPPDQISSVMEDAAVSTWKGRNPAYADFRGTFDLAVATSFLDAWDHPLRQLIHDAPTVPSTVIPVEFTNYHYISVGADVHGAERLDLGAWSVFFAYEGGRPKIVAFTKEG